MLALLSRYINNWVAAVIARRERQATIVRLRQLNDRELKDVCLDRWGIDAVLAEARREGGSRDDPYFNLPPR